MKAKQSLEIRTYHREACGLTMDRDHNAAVNLARWTSQPTSAGTHSVDGRGGKTAETEACQPG
ncbi:MAG: transposase [Acidimicrobiaceae bacterium]|nr:transposase [Acidimicrobiaceae bacterium]